MEILHTLLMVLVFLVIAIIAIRVQLNLDNTTKAKALQSREEAEKD